VAVVCGAPNLTANICLVSDRLTDSGQAAAAATEVVPTDWERRIGQRRCSATTTQFLISSLRKHISAAASVSTDEIPANSRPIIPPAFLDWAGVESWRAD
jgi:hypothetical protein